MDIKPCEGRLHKHAQDSWSTSVALTPLLDSASGYVCFLGSLCSWGALEWPEEFLILFSFDLSSLFPDTPCPCFPGWHIYVPPLAAWLAYFLNYGRQHNAPSPTQITCPNLQNLWVCSIMWQRGIEVQLQMELWWLTANLEMRDCPGLSGWAQCNHRVLLGGRGR